MRVARCGGGVDKRKSKGGDHAAMFKTSGSRDCARVSGSLRV